MHYKFSPSALGRWQRSVYEDTRRICIPDDYIRENNMLGLDPLINRELLTLKPRNSAILKPLVCVGRRKRRRVAMAGVGRSVSGSFVSATRSVLRVFMNSSDVAGAGSKRGVGRRVVGPLKPAVRSVPFSHSSSSTTCGAESSRRSASHFLRYVRFYPQCEQQGGEDEIRLSAVSR